MLELTMLPSPATIMEMRTEIEQRGSALMPLFFLPEVSAETLAISFLESIESINVRVSSFETTLTGATFTGVVESPGHRDGQLALVEIRWGSGDENHLFAGSIAITGETSDRC